MDVAKIQELCEIGQTQLMRMEYWEAELTLVQAEAIALKTEDYDALARLYMPLQEARRQRRQKCLEGPVRAIVAGNAADVISPEKLLRDFKQGTLFIAGWDSTRPALQVREAIASFRLYVDVFVASISESPKILVEPNVVLQSPAEIPTDDKEIM